ncbi:MAG: GNAT family N-acetyltransferase [Acidimicrobiales bacterium]
MTERTRQHALTAVVRSPAPRAAWLECCAADETGMVTQTPAWVDAMVAAGGWNDVSRHYTLSDGRTFVLPLVTRTRRGGVGPRYSMPDAWGFGGLVGADLDARAVAAVLADLAELRSMWVRVRPTPTHAQTWHDGAALAGGTIEIAKRAHVLELDGATHDDIFTSRFASSCRRAVRSAEKAGLTVEVDTDGRLVSVFYSLFQRSVDRWATSQHEPKALARLRAARRDPMEKFDAWAGALDGACRILVARRGDVPIAALIVLQGTNAHMTRGAMDRELVANDRPNELLMWHAIRDAIDAGCHSFHMGESGNSESLARYKEKYGARPIDYAEHRIERVPGTAVGAASRSAVKRVIGFRDT